MQKITSFLWFNNEALEAAKFYVSVFNNNPARKIKSKLGHTSHYDKSGAEVSGREEGTPMVVSFELEGREFNALNGGPQFTFSPATSFMVSCKTQEEVDYFWEKLSDGGETGQCGWINRDKFGMTWQIVPTALGKLMSDADPEKSERVMQAMLKMTKIDIKILKQAYEGKIL